MTATPNETSAVCISNPVHRPRVTKRPAFRPWRADCVKTKILSEPDTNAKATDVEKKRTIISIDINLRFPLNIFKLPFTRMAISVTI